MKIGSNYLINRIMNMRSIKSKSEKSYSKTRHVIQDSGLFDPKFYQKQYRKNIPSGMDALDHYIKIGAESGFAPNPWFETDFYLTSNPDVKDAGLNPLLHFSQHGWKELRAPSPRYDLIWHWIIDNKGDFSAENPMARHCAQYAVAPGEVSVRAPEPLSSDEKTVFVDACRSALSQQDIPESALCLIANYAAQNGLWGIAEEAYHVLILKRPDKIEYKQSLADILERQGRIWQVIDMLEEAAAQGVASAELLFRLGEMRERMARYEGAASSFEKALAANPTLPEWHYRYGYALEQMGRMSAAQAAYGKARELDSKDNASQFGVGVFHQKRGLWKQAAEAYATEAAQKPDDPELWFKLGFAHDRCYEWAKAQYAYSVALSMQLERPYTHYRLGFVLERQEKWREAAGAYRTGADMDAVHRGYWYYRCGYVLEKAGAYAEACSAYLMADKARWGAYRVAGAAVYTEWFPQGQDKRTPSTEIVQGFTGAPTDTAGSYWETLSYEWEGFSRARTQSGMPRMAGHIHARGKISEIAGNWEAAAQAYRSALEISASHEPTWYRDLGAVLMQLGRYDEACEAFRNSRILKRPYGVNVSKYESNKGTKSLMEYCEYLETFPIRRNAILYDSWLGKAIGCNPYAIFRYIIDRPEFSGWTHIWAINDISGIPGEYADRKDVIFVPRNSDAYRRYLATAEYLINNVTFPYWFIRREDQKYLNTWHGTPLKGLGRDVKNESMAHGNVTRNFLHATHLLNPNQHTSDVMMKRHDVDGIYPGKLAETGYPRVDQVVKPDETRRRKVLEELGLKADKPIILYAPTWRGVQGHPQTDCDRVVEDVSAMISEEYQLVFRGHHLMEAALAGKNIPVAVAPQKIDACDLLSIADVLVTDYSSIFFDFLPTGRPIIYYAYDLEEYASEHGFYFDLEDLPGELCAEIEDVREAIMEGLSGQSLKDDSAYRQAQARFCPFEDGNATRRAVEFFFFGSDECVVDRYEDSRKSIIMYNGMFPINGITSSYLSLLNSLEGEDVQISTLFDPAKIGIDPIRIEKFGSMPPGVKRIAHIGPMVMTPEEIWVIEQLRARQVADSQEMRDVQCHAYRREYRRVLGEAKHDTFVNFEGYHAITAHMVAAAPAGIRKVIYLHNDMIGERDVRLPYLQRIFRLYDCYDSLISVSDSISNVNRDSLCSEFHIDRRKFSYCENTIDVKRVLANAQDEVDRDLRPWFGGGVTFLCLARLSPEKGQIKLLRAFSAVLKQRSDARLVILGDGPLRQDLDFLIDELGMGGNVYLGGLRVNPFSALKAADCLVLPSEHEGQGLVLVEAMVLGKPIIATDIVTSRDVLGNDYAGLVENSEEGLRSGMLQFLERGGESHAFDASAYQANAIADFKSVVLGLKCE